MIFLEDFGKFCEQYFGYIDVKQTLGKLLVTMFVTYTGRYLHVEFPEAYAIFLKVENRCLTCISINIGFNI